jgi:acyl-coenzyme A thioesterase PaaI-like protein
MKLSEFSAKMIINLFPPLFFNRIKVTKVEKGFKHLRVRVKHSVLNKNIQKSIFGGTIFSAADPYYALMYWQIFAHRGVSLEAWLKSAEIEYVKPSTSNLTLDFRLSDLDIKEAEEAIASDGRFRKWHEVEAIDEQGDVCAVIRTQVYLRKKQT